MSLVGKLAGRVRWLIRSSTLRLTLLLSFLFAIGMAVAIVVALILGREAVVSRVDTSLAGLAAAVAANDVPRDTFSVIIRPVSELDGLPKAFARAAERGGGTVGLKKDFRRSEEWRVLISEDSRGTPVLIAVPLDDSLDALDLLGNILWTTAGLVLAVALIIGLGAGWLAQRRLSGINGTLGRLAEGDLKARTGNKRSADDLDDLARQLDRTADELERLVSQTRYLSASLAHDLRTPLARLRARLEMMPEGEERGAALEEAGRLSDIFDTIMRIARIEAGVGSDGFENVSLGDLMTDVAGIYEAVIEDSGKRLDLSVNTPAMVFADRQMLVQAMANLIQNALVHGGEVITLFAQGREVGVADNGDGVDPTQFMEIVKPMVRLDTARERDGTGLGLALVRAVADRHGAHLILSENAPTGLRAALKFTEL